MTVDDPGDAPERPTLPYGSWPSPIRIEDLVGGIVRLSDPWVDGDDVYWLEGRPAEGGRTVLVTRSSDGLTRDVTPPPFDVRSRVHEYGGGAYVVAGGTVLFSHVGDGRLYRLDPGDDTPQPLTPDGPFRYADLRSDPARRRFIAVREDHTAEGDPRAAIVDIALDGDRPVRVLYEGPDFLAAPRPSPDGDRLAWLEWDHPDMPWDATRLWVGLLDLSQGDPRLVDPQVVAGRAGESVCQPAWDPDGRLWFVSDRTGWWNLYRSAETGRPTGEPLAVDPGEWEVGEPAWVFGQSRYDFLSDGRVVFARRSAGRDQLAVDCGVFNERARSSECLLELSKRKKIFLLRCVTVANTTMLKLASDFKQLLFALKELVFQSRVNVFTLDCTTH